MKIRGRGVERIRKGFWMEERGQKPGARDKRHIKAVHGKRPNALQWGSQRDERVGGCMAQNSKMARVVWGAAVGKLGLSAALGHVHLGWRIWKV